MMNPVRALTIAMVVTMGASAQSDPLGVGRWHCTRKGIDA
jgi:hypothetical protein